jgi:DNA-binding NarL/FixJ family response regulator
MFHRSLVGSPSRADKGPVPERVLIVDDHPLTRDALSALLAQQGFEVVGEAADGMEALTEARRKHPDVVLLDLTMPGLDGLSVLPRIREEVPGSEVVVLTASDTEENLLAAIRAGASGYLLKTESPEQIAAFLRGVVRGDAALSGGVARRLLDRVREYGRFGGVPDSITEILSAREVEVLLLLDEHLGTDEIAERLFISEHTVRSHVKNLLKKLGVSSRREALERLDSARAA